MYLPGEQNIADPLSHLLHVNEQAESSSAHKVSDEFVRFVAVTATPQAMTTREIEEASSMDREFVELCQHIKDRNWKGDQHKQYIPVCGKLCYWQVKSYQDCHTEQIETPNTESCP